VAILINLSLALLMASCLDITLMANLIVFNHETNTVVELCDVTFDKTTPCPREVFECASDKEMEEIIFVDEELHGFDVDEHEPLHPSMSSPELVPASTLDVEAPQATTSSTEQSWRHHGLRGRSAPSRVLPLTFKRHIHLNKSYLT
jgi:hypothetical protein